jgi:hypothetical protein
VEVARNPGRILSLGDRPDRHLADEILQVLLSAAAEASPDGGRTRASLLFGQTLREAAILALRAAVGNSGKAAAHLDALRTFIQVLNQASVKGQIGAREWLLLFDSHVANIFAKGLQADLNVASLLSELEQRDA